MNELIKQVAPRCLLVNGEPSPCKCTETTVCEYCSHVYLVLWEREQSKQERAMPDPILIEIKKRGIRRFSRLIGIDHKMVMKWTKTLVIPDRYRERTYRALGSGPYDHTRIEK